MKYSSSPFARSPVLHTYYVTVLLLLLLLLLLLFCTYYGLYYRGWRNKA